MSKRTFTIGALMVGLLLVGGGLLASNMGFKLTYELAGPGGASQDGTNTLALPFNRQSGINTSKALMDDIGSTSVVNIQQFDESNNGIAVYTGRAGTPDPDFGLNMGEAYFVQMNTTVNYVAVGSHDPAAGGGISLDGPGAGSQDGTNFFAVPYHTTASTAKQLMDDIGSTSVVNVQQFIESNNGIAVYTGRAGTPDPDFSLVVGEGYFIQMSSTVSYVPSHY